MPAPERGLQGALHVGPQLRAGVLAGGMGRRQLRRRHATVQVHQAVLAPSIASGSKLRPDDDRRHRGRRYIYIYIYIYICILDRKSVV